MDEDDDDEEEDPGTEAATQNMSADDRTGGADILSKMNAKNEFENDEEENCASGYGSDESRDF